MPSARWSYFLCPFLFGCALSGPPAKAPGQAQALNREEQAVRTALEQARAPKGDYKISSADLLKVTVYQQQDLDRKLRVSQNGTISFPLVGTLSVGGLTAAQAEATISDKLRDYLVNPQVTVFIEEYGNQKVFVLGEVEKPGSFELPPESRLTVLEAISLAGGFSKIAAPDRTKIIRAAGGKSESRTIVVSDITKKGERDKDLVLEPNDVVYVPQSFF